LAPHTLEIADTVDTHCEERLGGEAAAGLLSAHADLIGFLGPDSSAAAVNVSSAAPDDRFLLSSGSNAATLSDKAAYPNFLRVLPSPMLPPRFLRWLRKA